MGDDFEDLTNLEAKELDKVRMSEFTRSLSNTMGTNQQIVPNCCIYPVSFSSRISIHLLCFKFP